MDLFTVFVVTSVLLLNQQNMMFHCVHINRLNNKLNIDQSQAALWDCTV